MFVILFIIINIKTGHGKNCNLRDKVNFKQIEKWCRKYMCEIKLYIFLMDKYDVSEKLSLSLIDMQQCTLNYTLPVKSFWTVKGLIFL